MQGPLLLEFKELDVSINAQRYTETLSCIRLSKIIPGYAVVILNGLGVIILNDSARPHVAIVCVEALARKKWEVLKHPAYSSDMSPCDYHIFEPLKKSPMVQRFLSDDENAAVLNWFHDQPTSFFAHGIRTLPKQWDACLNAMGDFF
ncbi:uncharacterized protein TNCV_4101401 [Trichonephila clavipes]|nr:uncharacterized protein TNCV_4101401 [Trichonephila clavipes]